MIDLAKIDSGPLALLPGRLAWAESLAPSILNFEWQAANRKPRGTDPLPNWMVERVMQRNPEWRPYDVEDGAAILTVYGMLVPALGGLGWNRATGFAELRWQISLAMDDPRVKGIAFLFDSPGGFVNGCAATGAAIRAARDRKPCASIVEGSAFSAAYWLASQTGTISAPRAGGVGHVGVIAAHYDMRGLFRSMGVEPTIFSSGARKGDGHPLLPLSEAAAADIQATLDGLRGEFAAAVADGMGISLDAVLATEARAFDGPAAIEQALSLGLIDAILPADEALGAFTAGLSNPSMEEQDR